MKEKINYIHSQFSPFSFYQFDIFLYILATSKLKLKFLHIYCHFRDQCYNYKCIFYWYFLAEPLFRYLIFLLFLYLFVPNKPFVDKLFFHAKKTQLKIKTFDKNSRNKTARAKQRDFQFVGSFGRKIFILVINGPYFSSKTSIICLAHFPKFLYTKFFYFLSKICFMHEIWLI
jgi:hypothetical protein